MPASRRWPAASPATTRSPTSTSTPWPGDLRRPRRRPLAEAAAELDAFAAQPGWVIEGCYADLIEAVAPRASLVVFLNPGVDACVAHCRARPWEPHKYATPEAQDANLAMLLDWVRAYATRDDACRRRPG